MGDEAEGRDHCLPAIRVCATADRGECQTVEHRHALGCSLTDRRCFVAFLQVAEVEEVRQTNIELTAQVVTLESQLNSAQQVGMHEKWWAGLQCLTSH